MKRFLTKFTKSFLHNSSHSNYNPLIITCALTGNVPTKKMNSNVPITPIEIAQEAISVYHAGCSIVHIHARDENELPSQDLNTYREIVRLIKKDAPDLIIQLTTGGRSGKDPQLRCDVIRLCPEMGSFTTGSNNLAKICYLNSPDFLLQLGKTFQETGVKPEIECFDSGHLENAIYLVEEMGILSYPLHFNFVLGAVGAMPGTVHALQHMVDRVPENCTWNTCGLGNTQFDIATAAIAMGGNVRVGMEDQLLMPDGSLGSNIKMVEKVVRIAQEMNREIATPSETRKMLSLDESKKDLILEYLEDDSPIYPVDYSSLNLNL